MTGRQSPRISSRKQPKQARSTELVSAILEAATQLLAREGAQRFTTARVAEKAGVSIGSLYQYFPNKAAILFRLQHDEWRQTSAMLSLILEDGNRPPLDRMRALVHAFILSECEEAATRGALHDAAPLYRDAPEAVAAREAGTRTIQRFMATALPNCPQDMQHLAGDLIMETLSANGRRFSEKPRAADEIERYATALADMICAYLDALQQRRA